jgi:hypothetical protein
MSNVAPAMAPNQNTIGQSSGSGLVLPKNLPSDITARTTNPMNIKAAIMDKRKFVVSMLLVPYLTFNNWVELRFGEVEYPDAFVIWIALQLQHFF